MIIFYEIDTRKIIGTIEGRIHGQEHAKMWVGDKKKIGRIVIQWIPTEEKEVVIEKKIEIGKKIDKDGFYEPITKKVKEKHKIKEFEPNVKDKKQKEILIAIDKNPISIYDYIIDTNSLKLVKKKKLKKKEK